MTDYDPGWLDDMGSAEFRAGSEVCSMAGIPPTPEHLVVAQQSFVGLTRTMGIIVADLFGRLMAALRK